MKRRFQVGQIWSAVWLNSSSTERFVGYQFEIVYRSVAPDLTPCWLGVKLCDWHDPNDRDGRTQCWWFDESGRSTCEVGQFRLTRKRRNLLTGVAP